MLFSRVLIATAAAAIIGNVESFAPVISSSRSCQKIVSSQCMLYVCFNIVLPCKGGRVIWAAAAAAQLAINQYTRGGWRRSIVSLVDLRRQFFKK